MDHTGVSDNTWSQEFSGERAVQNLFALVRWRFLQLSQTEGFTQQELANRMGLTRSQISRWMRNPDTLTMRAAAKMLCAMGCVLEFQIKDMNGLPLTFR